MTEAAFAWLDLPPKYRYEKPAEKAPVRRKKIGSRGVMQEIARRAYARIRGHHLAAGCVCILLASVLAGCNTTGMTPLSMRDTKVAFESIDGPPASVFRKFVQKLNDQAEKRKVPVVSREQFTSYRLRGYLAASIEKKKQRVLISWVWDVYDASERRAVRFTGEEVAKLGSSNAWAQADDELLDRIAGRGMEQLAGYLGTAAPPAAATPSSPAAPDDRGYTVASRDDFRPEAAGIFRLFRPAEAAASESIENVQVADVPLPRRRPVKAGPSRDHVAMAESGS